MGLFLWGIKASAGMVIALIKQIFKAHMRCP